MLWDADILFTPIPSSNKLSILSRVAMYPAPSNGSQQVKDGHNNSVLYSSCLMAAKDGK